MKLTFKETKRKGLSAIGAGFYLEVKSKKKKFAVISGASSWSNKACSIQIAVKDYNDSKQWNWIFIENNCKDKEEAKAFISSIINEFIKTHELHFFEDNN